jgi:hypothetical protein
MVFCYRSAVLPACPRQTSDFFRSQRLFERAPELRRQNCCGLHATLIAPYTQQNVCLISYVLDAQLFVPPFGILLEIAQVFFQLIFRIGKDGGGNITQAAGGGYVVERHRYLRFVVG